MLWSSKNVGEEARKHAIGFGCQNTPGGPSSGPPVDD